MSALTFTTPPPGLEPLVDFTLDPVAGADGLFTLQSQERPEVGFFVVDSEALMPGYEPTLSPGSLHGIGVDGDPRLLLIATPQAEGATVNLMAPIVVNPASGRCCQVILDGAGYPVRAPLVTA